MLFRWDGSSDRVGDIDYVAWKDGALVYKSSSDCVDGVDPDETASCYLDDTPEASQSGIDAPGKEGSIHRCNFVESTEEKQGGNGVLDHDETSEDFTSTWKRNASTAADRTPGGPAPAGFCP
ncbi:MAG: hypothetical protein JRI55_40345 [Deltaproteobacteria bacterium]|jgi:hypothetical protein|nr:hypothetical protein [Deltaproteobacteria bacterium]